MPQLSEQLRKQPIRIGAKRVFTLFVVAACAFSQAPAPSHATLAGFTDNAVEDRGKITRLDITAHIRVLDPGNYRLTLDLTAPGSGLTGHAQKHLDVGEQILTVSFTAEEIRNYLAKDGPYAISDARLVLEPNSGDGGVVIADSSRANVSTRAYRLSDLYENPYSLTGEFEAEGIDVQPSGKFGALRVRFGITTPGVTCFPFASLLDKNGAVIQEAQNPQPLPNGKGMIAMVYSGPKIAAHGVDGPLMIRGISVDCRFARLATHTEFKTRSFRASDFDNPSPDFAFSLKTPAFWVQPGKTVRAFVVVQVIGASPEPVVLKVQSPEPKLQITNMTLPGQFTYDTYWQTPGYVYVSIQAPADLASGTYPVEVIGRRNGHEHSIRFNVIVL